MAYNPYEAPQQDAAPPTAGEVGKIPRASMSMPGTVIAAVALASVYLLLSLGGAVRNPGRAVVDIGLGALILVGLIRRHALAWQWGIIVPIIGAVFAAPRLLFVLFAPVNLEGALPMLVIMLALLALLIGIPALLSRHDSRLFFGLQCPRCQSMKVKAASFLFTRIKCKKCGARWSY